MRKIIIILLSLSLFFSFQLVLANEPLSLNMWKDDYYKKSFNEIVQSDSLISDLNSKPFILFLFGQSWFVIYPLEDGQYNYVYKIFKENIKEEVVNDPENILHWAFNEMPYIADIPDCINAIDGQYTPIPVEMILVNERHKIQNDFIAPPQEYIKKRKLRKKINKLYDFLYPFQPDSPLKNGILEIF